MDALKEEHRVATEAYADEVDALRMEVEELQNENAQLH